MAESFVKTFKRDYVRVNPLPDAITALRQITGWFDDYNDNHPHSGGTVKLARGGHLWHGLGHEHNVQSLPGLPLSG